MPGYGGIFTSLPLARIKHMALEKGDPAGLPTNLLGGTKIIHFLEDQAQVGALL
jgi:hypothetical protein